MYRTCRCLRRLPHLLLRRFRNSSLGLTRTALGVFAILLRLVRQDPAKEETSQAKYNDLKGKTHRPMVDRLHPPVTSICVPSREFEVPCAKSAQQSEYIPSVTPWIA